MMKTEILLKDLDLFPTEIIFFKHGNGSIIILFPVVWFFCPGCCDFRIMTYTTVKTMIVVYVQPIL